MTRAKNVVALGASALLMGLPVQEVGDAVAERFRSKGDDVVAANRAALRAGFDEARAMFGGPRFEPPGRETGPAMFMNGNEAFSLGAIAAGCRLAAAYPITPASDILEFLTPRLQALGGAALQMEDEMAALGLCIGAGHAGARAMTATSGPGLSLMTEMLGLAGSTETPVVIVDCQRPGPSTGMPTKHGQEDLWHMMHGGHGEAPRIVLAPMDVGDAFRTAAQAFALADRFRCPTLVAMDQQVCMMNQTIAPLDVEAAAGEAPRHRATPAAGSAWRGTYDAYDDAGGAPVAPARPGDEALWYANSTEHGPNGFTNEDPAIRDRMVERRLERVAAIPHAVEDAIVVSGPDDADVVIATWGSTTGACLEAQARLAGQGVAARVVALRLLWPFPRHAVTAALGPDAPILVAEANAFAQAARLLRSELPVHDRTTEVLRFDGTPVQSDDVLAAWNRRDA